MTMSQSIPARSTGVSLIELMVALAITALLLLGVSEIFLGSRATFTVQQAMSRSQENARFAFNTFENAIRMAGYFGCSNDRDSKLTDTNIASSRYWDRILANPSTDDLQSIVNFRRSIEGFDYTACNSTSCDTDGNQPAVGAVGEWSPSLANSGIPLSGSANPVKGSDVLVLRILSAESAPIITSPLSTLYLQEIVNGGEKAVFSTGPASGDPDFIRPYSVYAVTTCSPSVDLFIASPGSSGTSLISGPDVNLWRGGAGTDPGPWKLTSDMQWAYTRPPSYDPNRFIAEVHRADYMVLFVGLDSAGNPTLKMQHYSGAMNGTLPGVTVEDLADGVEAMQVLYGVDTNGDGLVDPPYKNASEVVNGATDPKDIDDAWRKVVSVRIGLLMRGQNTVNVPANASGNVYTVEDAVMTRPADGRYRDVYETTIALRNRLSNPSEGSGP